MNGITFTIEQVGSLWQATYHHPAGGWVTISAPTKDALIRRIRDLLDELLP